MSISTLSLNNANRATLMRLQGDLKDATKELTTERHADVGAALGRLTGTAVNYRVQETSIDAQLETNKVIAGRLDLAGGAMSAIAKSAEDMTGPLLGAEKFSDYPTLAKSALEQLQGGLNTVIGGAYVFGGENAGEAPIKNVDDGIAAAKASYDTFLTSIGKTSATVTADELSGFLTTAFMDTVGDPWAGNASAMPPVTAVWSNASDRNTKAHISKSEEVETSVSANDTSFRNITAAYSMLAAIATPDLNDAARTALARGAATTLKTGLDGLTTLRASVGTRQARVEAADKALTQQKDIVNAAFTRLEGVDQTEAGLRVTQLETQLQASYTVTGRLQKLSILDYI